jgi:small subunit ribosomal protein S7e
LTEYEQQDGSASKALLVKIPFRSLQAFQKVSEKLVSHLESKFNWPVIVVANRTIISKRAKHHASQKRPRSRTLTAVHAAVLEDIVSD